MTTVSLLTLCPEACIVADIVNTDTKGCVMADTDTVHAAIAELALAHRAYREERERARTEQRNLRHAWKSRVLQAVPSDLVDDEDKEVDDETLEELVNEFLEGSQDMLVLPSGEGLTFDDAPEARRRLVELDEAVRAAGVRLERPQAELAARLQKWLEAVRSEAMPADAIDSWPGILRSWRQALDLTTREAAKQLDVSPAAVVRYEKDPGQPGGRTPKLPNVAAMVERMASVLPLVPDSEERSGAEALADMWPELSMTELLDRFERPQAELIDSIEGALPGLTFRQLQLLASLATDHQAIDALLGWVDRYGEEPLRPVFDAAVAVGVRQTSSPAGEPS